MYWGNPMHLRGLNLNLLVALDALLGERSVTAAGKKLHLSQSTMSIALARLRKHLGDPILVPLGRSMVLTDLGRELEKPVRQLLLQIEATMREREAFDPGLSVRNFRIAASDYSIYLLLLDVRRRFDQIAPHISLEILPVVHETLHSFEQGEVDLLILPDRYRLKSCQHHVLFRDRLVCIAARANENIGPRITLPQFRTADHVLFQPDPGHVIAVDRWLRKRYRFVPSVKLCVPTYSLVPMAVAGTSRIASIPERLAGLYCTMLPIRIVEPSFPMPPIIEVMQWHQSRSADPGLTWLRSLLVEAAFALSEVANADAGRPPNKPSVRARKLSRA
jgi:DNA-binding transcriptional LysR family regulator